MPVSTFEETLSAFENRMALRREMMRVTGVSLTQQQITDDPSGEVETSIRKCAACKNADVCAPWVSTAEDETPPPAFCPNAELLRSLSAAEFKEYEEC